MAVEGYTGPRTKRMYEGDYVPYESIGLPKDFETVPEYRQFIEQQHGIAPYFFAKAQVGGLLRRKSALYEKENRGGKPKHFLVIIIDTGPIYLRTRDLRRRKLRNMITCFIYGRQAIRLNKDLIAYSEQMHSQPWLMINGHIEAEFLWVDKENLWKGKKPSGEMLVRSTGYFIPPIPKPCHVKEKFREDPFPNAPTIRV